MSKKIRTCSLCGSDNVKTTHVNWGSPAADLRQEDDLCPYCYETDAGNILHYRNHSSAEQLIARLLCQMMNLFEKRK